MSVDASIEGWRNHLLARGAVSEGDVDELEDHLRAQIAGLRASGLDEDEALLIAVRRMGRQDEISNEYARESSRRLWKQLVLDGGPRERRLDGLAAVLLFAVIAALAAKVPALLGTRDLVAVLDGAILAGAGLAAYLVWRHRPPVVLTTVTGVGFALMTALAVVYPFGNSSDTVVIFGLNAPVLLWLLIGLIYAGAGWRSSARRMDFVRFTGEWAIYLALMALGGGVLIALIAAVFGALGHDPSTLLSQWVAPFGAAGAAVVAAWLVDAKQEVIENMAPVLGRIFTPLFTIAVLAMLAAACISGGFGGNRDVLIAVDVLLVVVAALVLYVLSAQQPAAAPGWTERIQLVLIVSAFALDGFALAAMAGRIVAADITPNRLVALGVNLVLLVSLAGAGWLLGRRLLGGRRPGARMPRPDTSAGRLLGWQTGYLPVYAAWALLAAVVIPPVFAFS